MSSPTIDYDALAKQYGATSSQIDYNALAKQHGAISPVSPTEKPGYGSEIWGGIKRFGQSLASMPEQSIQLMQPRNTVESALAPSGSPVLGAVHLATDFGRGLVGSAKAGLQARRQGENWAGQTLATAEQLPIVGPMVQHAEQGGTRIFSPQSVGAATEASLYAASPKIVEGASAAATALRPPISRGLTAARNLAVGPNPEAIPAEQAFIKATKPRNSITNVTERVNTALPDARRAADSLGIDVNTMTLEDAERAVVQAKKDVWGEFEQNHLGPNRHVSLEMDPVADAVQGTATRMTDVQSRRMAGLKDEIGQAASDYRGKQMTLGQIEDRIQELNNELRSQQSQFKVNETALRRDPRYSYKFAELDGLRKMENQAFQELSGANVADLKQRYGSLKTLEDVIDRRIPVVERQNPARLFETAGRISGLGDITRGILAREPSTLAAGFVKMRAGQNAQMLNDPNFLIQQAFKKTAPRGALTPGSPTPFNLPPVSGGSPTAGTASGAAQDTAFFAQAKQEMPNASVSDQLRRAQQLKTQATPAEEDFIEMARRGASERPPEAYPINYVPLEKRLADIQAENAKIGERIAGRSQTKQAQETAATKLRKLKRDPKTGKLIKE